jgi:lysophospholipase L1-like esterase
MSYNEANVNTRSTVKEKKGTNGVHPSTQGYYAIGDAFMRTLVKVLQDTKADYEGNNA